MTTHDMDIAERIVFELRGPATLEAWYDRLPNRPDWQAAIELVRDLLREHRVKP